jgi:PAS domain S-box-containing protein
MVLDEDGSIRYQTESTKRLLGYNDNELVGRSLVDLLHLHSKAAGRAAINRMTRNESKFEAWKLRFNTASGDTIWLEGMASNFLKDPRLGGIMVYWRELNA